MQRLAAALAALALSTTTPVHAAVHFNGLVGTANPGTVGGPPASNAAVCHLWIKASHIETMTILQILDPVSHYESFAISLVFWGENDMRANLTAFGTDYNYELLGLTKVEIGDWREIGFAIDTDFPAATFVYDGFKRGFDSDGTLGPESTAWQFKISGQEYRVGGAFTNSAGVNIPLLMIGGQYYGSAIEPFLGDMEQLYCSFNESSYVDMGLLGPGHGFSNVVYSGGFPAAPGPVALGPKCEGILLFTPELCMQGTRDSFLNNKGGATSFSEFGGILTPATSSPFDLWHQ